MLQHGNSGAVNPLPYAKEGELARFALSIEDVWVFFLYSITTNTPKISFSSQLGTHILKISFGGHIDIALGMRESYKAFYMLCKWCRKLSNPTRLIDSKGNIAAYLRNYCKCWQQKKPNDGVLERLIFKLPTRGNCPFCSEMLHAPLSDS